MSYVFRIGCLSNPRLSVVLGAAVVFICTRCGRGRCGPRLWSRPHTLSESYIRFDAFDLSQLICLNDALYLPSVMQYGYAMIMISFRSYSKSLSDSFCLLTLAVQEQNINTTSGYQLY